MNDVDEAKLEKFFNLVQSENDRSRVLITQYFGDTSNLKHIIRLAILDSALDEVRPSFLRDNEAVQLYKSIRDGTKAVVVTKEE